MGHNDTKQAAGIRFDGQVAVVTGAGGGLGKGYAVALAERGAQVVVNDVGCDREGYGSSTAPADAAVAEIAALGGCATANYESVATLEGGNRIVETALSSFGRLDILVSNAGIIRDRTFARMSAEEWAGVLSVHLQGAFNVTRPAFQVMRHQGYGRIVFATSAAGLFGNYGQVNYAAAKMGLVGLMNALKLEGQKHGISVHAVAPFAGTRLTAGTFEPEFLDVLRPEHVTPLVVYLCSKQCAESGGIYGAGMGCFNRMALVAGPGVMLGGPEHIPTPEDVLSHWNEIHELGDASEYDSANTSLMALFAAPAPQGEHAG